VGRGQCPRRRRGPGRRATVSDFPSEETSVQPFRNRLQQPLHEEIRQVGPKRRVLHRPAMSGDPPLARLGPTLIGARAVGRRRVRHVGGVTPLGRLLGARAVRGSGHTTAPPLDFLVFCALLGGACDSERRGDTAPPASRAAPAVHGACAPPTRRRSRRPADCRCPPETTPRLWPNEMLEPLDADDATGTLRIPA